MAHRRYIHIFPPVAHYMEVFECYRAASARVRWLSAEIWPTWSAERPEWQDKENAVILWSYISLSHILKMIPPKRAATLALNYSESVGDETKISPGLAEVLRTFKASMKNFDYVIAGNPSAARSLAPYCRRVVVHPAGYDAETMGRPDWSAPKEHDLVFYGSPYGRREWILPELVRHFGKRLLVVTRGPFGIERKCLCDKARAILHVGHSDELGTPGFRIWQAVASSAALIAENRDAWPAVHGKHYVAIVPAQKGRIDVFIKDIEKALLLPLKDIARKAHAELGAFTVEKSMEHITGVF